MKAATRLRENSSVTLLASKTSVFQYKIEGSVKWRQSVAPPLRTTKALVKAAKVIPIAARMTHIPVDAGGGVYFCAVRGKPPVGTMPRGPPLPTLVGGRRSSLGSSWIVVAIFVTPRVLRTRLRHAPTGSAR